MTADQELEAALGRVMARPAKADEAAAQRVLARLASAPLPPQTRGFFRWPAALRSWDLAPAWPRIAALAGAAVLGITVGLSNLGTRIATDLDLVRVASAEDAGGTLFDPDSVTGLRP